jgi:hypothetical protein
MLQRTRWSAVGAAVAVVIGAGAVLPSANAAITGGARSVFVPIEPCRLFDTRPAPANVGPRTTPIGPEESYTQQVTGSNGHCEIPTDATAISMNVTTVDGTAASYLTMYPANAPSLPQASNLNWTQGAPPTPNKVDVRLSDNGAVKIYNNAGSVNVLADVVGYYADHNHDDRYYTKSEIDASVNDTLRSEVYGPWEVEWEQPAFLNLAILNGCHGNVTPSGMYGEIPIHLPIGSRLLSVDVVTFDSAGTGTYQVELIRSVLTGSITHFGLVTLGSGNAGVIHTQIVLPGTEIAPADVSYAVRVGSFQNSTNAFCQATVTYDTKP